MPPMWTKGHGAAAFLILQQRDRYHQLRTEMESSERKIVSNEKWFQLMLSTDGNGCALLQKKEDMMLIQLQGLHRRLGTGSNASGHHNIVISFAPKGEFSKEDHQQ